MNYDEAIEFINRYTKSGKKIKDLSRAETLMERIGNPHKSLKFVHIAGTNGKGSVLELMSQSLINAGYKTGQFTSPFMKCYEDRIRINSENISQEAVARLCTYVAKAVGDEEYSQFEITMAIAMLYFKGMKCDIVFLEAGIGGLLDSTNVIEEPIVSVITSVSLDHMDILGATVHEIAMQKAGIIKRGCPVVSSWNNMRVMDIFTKECIFKGCELIIPEPDELENVINDETEMSFAYKSERYVLKMRGNHQMINAATAIKALEVIKKSGYEKLDSEHVKKAFSEIQVPSRVEYFPGQLDVVIDGGHNPAGVSAMISAVRTFGIESAIVIFGMVDSKDAESCALLLSGFAKSVICVDGFAPNAIERTELVKYFKCEAYASGINDAFALAKVIARRSDSRAIVICGSLYMTEKFRRYVEK